MEHKTLGRTRRLVSVIGLGTWQLGSDWGDVSEDDALAVLAASAEAGVTFFDTADVYGDGRSEQIIGRFFAENPQYKDKITVATKMGRRVPQTVDAYNLANFRAWARRSLTNLGVDRLDLVQLHCPPSQVYLSDEVFDALDTLVSEGLIANYGVSVEKCDEALAAIARPNLSTVQIILNPFRLKPLEPVLPAASANNVGVIARVPLASGLLSGRYSANTQFAENDHRNYNRQGAAFDQGETFSGVDYEQGVAAARQFSRLVSDGFGDSLTSAQASLAWIWQQPGVSTVIPGARNVAQAYANAAAGSAPTLGAGFNYGVREIYYQNFRKAIHPKW
ncbi:MAG: aldo/keto reductase [Cellulomonadaceae bacterium]|nr:aldo/keto reductase [Cellulomonadaceae bacterium]